MAATSNSNGRNSIQDIGPHQLAEELAAFINLSPTAFHAADSALAMLKDHGITLLSEDEPWKLSRGKSYAVLREGSALVVFSSSDMRPQEGGVGIVGSHLDSPLLKLKGLQLEVSEHQLLAGIEVYGGPIYATWFDRDLILAGRVAIRRGSSLEMRNFILNDISAIIPNVAIHMNRKINEELNYNPQTEMRALLFSRQGYGESDLKDHIARELDVLSADILDAEAFLVPAEKADVFPVDKDSGIIRSGRIDNLAAAHASLKAFIDSAPGSHGQPRFLALYNSEEIGSRTRSGAASRFFDLVLQRFFIACGLNEEEGLIARQKSFQISVDAAHALHPNYPDKHDKNYRPLLNNGVAIKKSAGYKYGTDAPVAARLVLLAEAAGIKLQEMVNRADIPSGSTIGTISMTLLDIPTVDIGIPILAMHSVRETAGIADQYGMYRLLRTFMERETPRF